MENGQIHVTAWLLQYIRYVLHGQPVNYSLQDHHLELQKCMRNPIAFYTEMMGDIMYYNQEFQQPDAKQFANVVVKEINGHVDEKPGY